MLKTNIVYKLPIIIGLILSIALQFLVHPAVKAAALPVIHVSGSVSVNTTWQANTVYVLDNSLTIANGATLTIPATTIVKYGYFSGAIIVNTGGSIIVNGTTTNQTYFTSYYDDTRGGDSNADNTITTPAVGNYNSAIQLNGGTATITSAVFNYATTEISSTNIASGAVTIADSTFSNASKGIELQAAGSQVSIKRNTFTTSNTPLNVWGNGGNLINNVVFSGTDKNTFNGTGTYARIVNLGNVGISSGVLWTLSGEGGGTFNITGPIGINGGIVIAANTNVTASCGNSCITVYKAMTINAGAVIKYQNYGGNFVTIGSGGTLTVNGTATSRVLFTAVSTTAGSGAAAEPINLDWGKATINYADFQYAGTAIRGTATGNRLTLNNSTFSNDTHAIGLDGFGDTLVLQNNSFSTTDYAVAVRGYVTNPSDTTSYPSITGISLSGTTKNSFATSSNFTPNIIVSNASIPQNNTWNVDASANSVLAPSSFMINGTLNLALGSKVFMANGSGYDVRVYGTLNVNPGVIIKYGNASAGIQVYSSGILNVTASSSSPAVFTSYHDDIGGDSDGAAINPAASDYVGAVNMLGGTANINYATFRYAGTAINNAYATSGSNLQIQNSSFLDDGQGIDDRSLLSAPTIINNQFRTIGLPIRVSGIGNTYVDMTGIALSGANKNLFTRTGPLSDAVQIDYGTVPSGSTWSVTADSGAQLSTEGDFKIVGTLNVGSGTRLITSGYNNGKFNITGTLNLAAGSAVKSRTGGIGAIYVGTNGRLNSNGTSTSPVVFTSGADDSVGANDYGNATHSPSQSGDYGHAIYIDGGLVNATYTNIKYAQIGVRSLTQANQTSLFDNVKIQNSPVAYTVYGGEVNVSNGVLQGTNTNNNAAIVVVGGFITYRGSFSNYTEMVNSCSSTSGAQCYADVAYSSWPTAQGPDKQSGTSSNNNLVVCGNVGASPYYYNGTQYTTTLFHPDCGNLGSTQVTNLNSGMGVYGGRLAQDQIDCSGGFQDSCTSMQQHTQCWNAALNLAASQLPFPLPGSSTQSQISSFAVNLANAADGYITINEPSAVQGSNISRSLKVLDIINTFNSLSEAANSCS